MKCYENLHRKREKYSFMKVEIIWKHFKSPLLSVFEIELNTYNDFESYFVKNIREHRGVRQAYIFEEGRISDPKFKLGGCVRSTAFFKYACPILWIFFLFRGIRSKKIA